MVTIQKYIPPVSEPGYDKYYASEQTSEQHFEEFRCPQPFQRAVIRNMEITPCCSILLKVGDINKDTIYKIWHSSKMDELRDLHRNGEWYKNNICKLCVNLISPASRNIVHKSFSI